jgi:hypothetical protein
LAKASRIVVGETSENKTHDDPLLNLMRNNPLCHEYVHPEQKAAADPKNYQNQEVLSYVLKVAACSFDPITRALPSISPSAIERHSFHAKSNGRILVNRQCISLSRQPPTTA